MADPRIKTIKIKTGVLRRLTKEKTVYEKEVDQQKSRIEKIKAQGADEHDIKKQEEVLHECLMMVPDTQRRLAKAYEDLKGVLESEPDLKNIEEYSTAQKVLEEAKHQLPAPGELHMC